MTACGRSFLSWASAFALSHFILPPLLAQVQSSSGKHTSGSPPTAEVVHFWISQSESKALDVYRRSWRDQGGVWYDEPAKDKPSELKALSERMVKGYPPTAMQWHANEGSKELPAMGVVQDIDDLATAEHWRDFLPKNVVDLISYNGKIYFAPVNIHAENWLWSSTAIFDRLHLAQPTSWDDVFDSAAKIKAAGYIPIALGSQPWEISLVFNDIIFSVYGVDGYRRLMGANGAYAAMEPAMLTALHIFRRLSTYVAPSRTGKSWADAALDVGRGRAGMQFMGDYSKGELTNAGLVVDKDFRCQLAPGTESSYFIVIDAFAFPNTNNKSVRSSQLAFASMLMDNKNQLAFNGLKGSIPVRTDIQRVKLDRCGKIGMELISNRSKQMSAQSMIMPSQMSQGWIDIVAEYFNNPKISAVSTQRQLAELLSQK